LAGGFRVFASATFSSIARFWAMRAAVRSAGVIKWNGLFINYYHRSFHSGKSASTAGNGCQSGGERFVPSTKARPASISKRREAQLVDHPEDIRVDDE
jgi:hypothetical protein